MTVATRTVRAEDVVVGDDMAFLGRLHRVESIQPYDSPFGPGWIAHWRDGGAISMFPGWLYELAGPAGTALPEGTPR